MKEYNISLFNMNEGIGMAESVRAMENIRQFVKENGIPVREGRACVDGRYEHRGESSGFLSRPGADFGYVMGLLALRKSGDINLTPQQCFDAVYNIVSRDGGSFYMHTAENATDDIEKGKDRNALVDPKNKKTACGHIGKALDPQFAAIYGVNPEDVAFTLEYARSEAKKPERRIKEVVLKGEHAEGDTLIVYDSEKTIEHQNGREMHFVYDDARDAAFRTKIALEAKIDGLSPQNYADALSRQTSAILSILAPNTPIYGIEFVDEASPRIKAMGRVQPLELAA